MRTVAYESAGLATCCRNITQYNVALACLLEWVQPRTSHSPVAAAGRSSAAVSHAVAVSRRNSLRSSSRVNAAALLRPPPPCKAGSRHAYQ